MPTLTNAAPDELFDRWLVGTPADIRRNRLVLLDEAAGTRAEALEHVRAAARDHYVDPGVTTKRLIGLGAPATANLLREHLPSSKRARSGDIGEILATEYAERKLAFLVPVRRLRWKDGRDMALRGDDIVAVVQDGNRIERFLKGESKSRGTLSDSVISEAAEALDRDGGRPSRHSVLFVADRLRESGLDDLAVLLEEAVLGSFRDQKVEHLLFTFSGNAPGLHLRNHLEAYRKQPVRHAVGIRVEDHAAFIRELYEGI